jgi:hypothetical protein
MTKPKNIAALCGLVGLLIPVILVVIDRSISGGWWPRWVIYVWPTSYMLIANSAVMDATAYTIIVFSAFLNAVLYALLGLGIYSAIRAAAA